MYSSMDNNNRPAVVSVKAGVDVTEMVHKPGLTKDI